MKVEIFDAKTKKEEPLRLRLARRMGCIVL